MLQATSAKMKLIWQLLAGGGVLGTLDTIRLAGPGGAIYRSELRNTLRLDDSGSLRPL